MRRQAALLVLLPVLADLGCAHDAEEKTNVFLELRDLLHASRKFWAAGALSQAHSRRILRQTDCLWGNAEIITLDNGYLDVL